MYPSKLESSLSLTRLSPADNGREITCSAENVVGQKEATLQLNVLCKNSRADHWRSEARSVQVQRSNSTVAQLVSI